MMLKRKQYWISLGIAVLVFFIAFLVAYLYFLYTGSSVQEDKVAKVTAYEQSIVGLKEEEPMVKITPYTKVILTLLDEMGKTVETASIEVGSVIGLDEEELKERFIGYDITRFNEKEVLLSKKINTTAVSINERDEDESKRYVLGISGEYICIAEEVSQEVIAILDLRAVEFSSQTYSQLLSRSVHLTSVECETLIEHPEQIFIILQAYNTY